MPSIITFNTEFGDTVSVESYPGGRFLLEVRNELGHAAVALEAEKAREVSTALRGGSVPSDDDDYEAVLETLFTRLAQGVASTPVPALQNALIALGLGFALDNSEETRNVVRALVGR